VREMSFGRAPTGVLQELGPWLLVGPHTAYGPSALLRHASPHLALGACRQRSTEVEQIPVRLAGTQGARDGISLISVEREREPFR